MSQMQQTMEESIDTVFRKLNISSNSPVAHMNHHSSNSSATHVPLEIPNLTCCLLIFLVKHLWLETLFLINRGRRVRWFLVYQ
jgi:hypothetical protein